MHKISNYIFDLDGTIIDSSVEVLACFKIAFKDAGYQIDESRLTSDVIGPPLKQIIQTIAPELTDENTISTIIQNFRRIYDYDENDISETYEEIISLLQDLKKQSRKLFIATFKPTIPTLRLVEKFKLKEFFDDIYTIDKFGNKITKEEMISDIITSYNLDKTKTVMIGDAASDITAAHHAGIKGIGVLWGYGKDKEPLINIADYIVKDTKELRECLKLNCLTI